MRASRLRCSTVLRNKIFAALCLRGYFGSSAIQCCYAAIEIPKVSQPLHLLFKMNTQTDRAMRKKVRLK